LIDIHAFEKMAVLSLKGGGGACLGGIYQDPFNFHIVILFGLAKSLEISAGSWR
jgi:hypothetical protein